MDATNSFKGLFSISIYLKCWMKYFWYLINKWFYSCCKCFSSLQCILIRFSQMEIFFWENHLSCLWNSYSSGLPFGPLKLNSGSIRLLCLSPQRMFKDWKSMAACSLTEHFGPWENSSMQKVKYQIFDNAKAWLYMCACPQTPDCGGKDSCKHKIKPTLKDTL